MFLSPAVVIWLRVQTRVIFRIMVVGILVVRVIHLRGGAVSIWS